jgi:Spy/CpxP family protein refolding chaperone
MAVRQSAFRAVLLVGALTFGGACIASAGEFNSDSTPYKSSDGRTGRGGSLDQKLERMTQDLNLTEDQQARIRSLFESERSDMEPLRERIRTMHREIDEEASRGSFNESRVRSLADDLARAQSEMIVARARMTSRLNAMLTPEQQSKLRDLHRQRFERFRERRESFRNRGEAH